MLVYGGRWTFDFDQFGSQSQDRPRPRSTLEAEFPAKFGHKLSCLSATTQPVSRSKPSQRYCDHRQETTTPRAVDQAHAGSACARQTQIVANRFHKWRGENLGNVKGGHIRQTETPEVAGTISSGRFHALGSHT